MTAKGSTFNPTGITDGAAVTTTNAATCGDAPSGSSILAGCTYLAAAAAHGSYGLSCQAASGVASFWDYSGFATTSRADVFYYTPKAITTSTQIYQTRTSAGQSYGLTHNATGVINVLDSAGAGKGNSPTMTVGTKYRIEVQGVSDAAAGQIMVEMFIGDATGTPFYSVSVGSQNTRGGNITNARIGKVSTSAETTAFFFDDFRTSDAGTTPLGPYVASNIAPIANAGPAQTNLEPYEPFALNGTASTDSDGSIVSWSWTQQSGDTTALVGANTATPTGITPPNVNGTTLVYLLTVTDNNGATGTSNVSLGVLPHTVWMKSSGGTLVPVQVTMKP